MLLLTYNRSYYLLLHFIPFSHGNMCNIHNNEHTPVGHKGPKGRLGHESPHGNSPTNSNFSRFSWIYSNSQPIFDDMKATKKGSKDRTYQFIKESRWVCTAEKYEFLMAQNTPYLELTVLYCAYLSVWFLAGDIEIWPYRKLSAIQLTVPRSAFHP
jgi:hypothetical protein